MTKEQFNALLHSPSTINLNMVKGLEEITQQFPYFRNAHLLLAKQYQGHENIRYESYLRKAAAYAADRRMLYDLIKLEPATIIHMHRDEPEIELKRQPESSTPSLSENQEQEPGTQQPSLQAILQAEMQVEDKFEYEILEHVTEHSNQENSVEQEEIVDDSTPGNIEEEETDQSNLIQQYSEQNTISAVNIEPESTNQEMEDSKSAIENQEVEAAQPDNKNGIPELMEIVPGLQSESITAEEAEESEKVEDVVEDVVTAEEVEDIKEATELEDLEEAAEVEDVEQAEETVEEISVEEVSASEYNSESTDPKEIIEQRLREIANPSNQEAEVSEQYTEKYEDAQPMIEPVSSINNNIVEVSEEIKEEKISPPKEEVKKPVEHHTFLDWLKLKDIPVLPVERKRDYFEKMEERHLDADGNPIDPEDELIENFIKTEPRIVPAKSEFYSPGNMARQSAMEHEDLISETLARIYAQQGNIPKAIDAYRRLSLKLPEKSSYFAALIRELEENNPS